MSYLLKTEPSEYSFEDLQREGRTRWDGVRNPLAQRYISCMRVGDLCFIYHTGRVRAVVGTAKVASEPYRDEKGLWVVDITPEQRLKKPVVLDILKKEPSFEDSLLLRMGRLSVVPLTREQVKRILELSQ
ncbi:MAG: EVE domain-containing protein [Acidobacteria bacterium]|jgi:predicted RNA-binding protein with PUA-like domain|nr:MAG: EVE domain-containing protein [Acidobacteriota bacterium]